MRKLFLFLISVCTVLFNMQFCQAIRFDPALTDEDLRILGNKYSSVGMVIHEVEYVFEDGSHYSVEPVKSTATLVSLPNFKQDDGSLILVSNHAFKNWNKEEHSFSFTLNGETSRIINYFQAPAEDLIETWWCCFSSATTLQRDFGFALLEKPIKSTSPAQLILDNFSDLPSDAILTTVGVGDAGRLDSFYTFTDNQRRAMETYVHEYKVATVDQGIKAQQDDDPLRLEHTYSSARDDLHGNLVRGKIADENSTGQAPWYQGRPKGRGQAALAPCLPAPAVLYNV